MPNMKSVTQNSNPNLLSKHPTPVVAHSFSCRKKLVPKLLKNNTTIILLDLKITLYRKVQNSLNASGN